MAVHKAIRSNPLAQPQHAKTARRRPNPESQKPQVNEPQISDSPQPREDPQRKSHLLETLRHLNRGFGVVLAAFDRLQKQDRLHRPGIFPQDCLRNYRNRTERLRALANRDLLQLIAGREDQDANRFGRLISGPVKPNR